MKKTWCVAFCAACLMLMACEEDEAGEATDTGGASGDAAADTGGASGDTGGTGDATMDDTTMAEPDWSCLGNVVFDTPTESTATITSNVVAFGTGDPAVDIAYDVCGFADTNCGSPIFSGMTDEAGVAMFDVPLGDIGFDGYVQVTTSATFYPTLAFFNPPIVEDSDLGLALIQNSVFDLFAQALGVTVDSSRGHLAFLVLDCGGAPASGVTLSVSTADSDSTFAYVVDGGPAPNATETAGDGAIGVFNIPEGPAVITATNSDNQTVAEYGFFVVAGAISQSNIVPSP